MQNLNMWRPQRILLRGVNWIGDAVMSLPALNALSAAWPQARIEVLARPLVAELYAQQPGVARVELIDDQGPHRGLSGILKLARSLRGHNYQGAVLLQNAFKAAFLAFAAGIAIRIGYSRDGRGFLLTHPLPCPPSVRQMHETAYYLNIIHQAGLIPPPPPAGQQPVLCLGPPARQFAQDFVAGLHNSRLLGLAPGASFGPAKRWPAVNFAAAASALAARHRLQVVILGGAEELELARQVGAAITTAPVMNMCGRLSLSQSLALLERLSLLLSNDSGLMHAAAALGCPTCALFGSTNPLTTRPLGPQVKILRKAVDCSPCLCPVCPRGDMRCFTAITPEEVEAAVSEWL
jgi:heptosyltransferase-2